MKQTPNNNKATMNNKATAKQTKKQRKAATEELCNVTTNKIEIEVLDGILLNLNIRSKMKPSKVQDRILRRIVEKRQAQASHKKHGRSEDLTSMHITLACTRKCMKDISKKRYAA